MVVEGPGERLKVCVACSSSSSICLGRGGRFNEAGCHSIRPVHRCQDEVGSEPSESGDSLDGDEASAEALASRSTMASGCGLLRRCTQRVMDATGDISLWNVSWPRSDEARGRAGPPTPKPGTWRSLGGRRWSDATLAPAGP